MAKIMGIIEAQTQTIAEEMRRDPNIFIFGYNDGINRILIDRDLTRVKPIIKEFGRERISATGICENHEAGAGVGAALAGTRPIVSLQSTDFALDGWGQLVQQAAFVRFKIGYKLDCPVIFHMNVYAAGFRGTVHHSGYYANWLANTPGLFTVVPATPADAVGLWRTALRKAKDPMAMLQTGDLKGPVPDDDYTIPFGVADIKHEGEDVTIVAVGASLIQMALEVAEDLADQGISAEIWDPRTLIPLDRGSLIDSVRKTGAMVVVDVAPKTFGTTGEFMATVAENIYPVPSMARVATLDIPRGAASTLITPMYPTKAKIIEAVFKVLGQKNEGS